MITPTARFQFVRLTAGARLFGIVVLATPVLWSRDPSAGLALLAIAVVWAAASAAEQLRINVTVALAAEAALIGTVCALSLDFSLAVLGALAVPPFTASLRQGPRGMLLALSAQLSFLVVLSTILRGPMNPDEGTGTFTWVVIGLGLGLIGSFLRSTLRTSADALTPYLDAQALIRELLDLSGSLSSGLDPLSLATTVAESLRDELPVSALLVQVPRQGGLSPLVTEIADLPGAAETLTDLSAVAGRTLRPASSGSAFAFPVRTDAGLVAVVAGLLTEGLDASAMQLESRLEKLAARLEPTAVQLDTALLFTAFREAATSEERRRLGREMHDGIAQDIASLGYLVDNASRETASAEQAAQLWQLRERISTIVAEVRSSVQSLRTEIGASDSLGTAISGHARRLSASSSIPIHVLIDEGSGRLGNGVEGELLRVAQEAMTNAVRHSGASTIEVLCTVHAPHAQIVVRDDGVGLRPGRHDSQGIDIMHERARLAGAELCLEAATPHGTIVTVEVATTAAPAAPAHDDKVSA